MVKHKLLLPLFSPWEQVGQLLYPTILPGEAEGQVQHRLLPEDPGHLQTRLVPGDFLL